MKQRATSKLLRAVLIAAVLLLGLVSGPLDKSSCVGAKSCDDAFMDYFNADATYETARISYFYDEPTTCATECSNSNSTDPNCVPTCRTTRHTALGNAEIGLFSAAGATCAPATFDQCGAARAMANSCQAQYNFNDYSDLDERLAVYSQYSACVEASKVSSCE